MNVFGAEKTCWLYIGNERDLDCDFVFATSTMLARHLTEFDYICYDEVHHIVAECGKKY